MILSMTDLEPYRDDGLCGDGLDAARAILGDEPRPVREQVGRYLDGGGDWRNVVRAYQRLVRAGRLPDRGVVWRIAEIAFREQPERNAALRRWGAPGALGLATWREARAAAYAAAYVGSYAADAADAAAEAAYAADVADAVADAAYAAAAYAADAVRARVRNEIIEIIVAACEATP